MCSELVVLDVLDHIMFIFKTRYLVNITIAIVFPFTVNTKKVSKGDSNKKLL